jgi:hypothetical protein
MNASAPRLGIAALAIIAAAAVTFGPALLLNNERPAPRSHGEVSIAQLMVDKDMRVIAPAQKDGVIATVTVKASR